jgi:hypothetical protein
MEIETFTINIVPMNGRLQVTIPEIDVTVETVGTRRDEAIDAAHRAITEYLLKTREQSQAKAS